MKTDNPEVVAYLHTNKENPEHRGVSLHHDASCTNTLINTEPLIRLSDYERLQADHQGLQAELARELQRRFDGNEQTSREHRAEVKALVEALRVLVDNGGIGPESMFDDARAALDAYHNGGGE